MPDDKIYKIPVREEIVVLKADTPRQLKLGWVVKEKIGIGCITKSAKNILLGHKKVRSVLIE
jgi:hypothetical protein